MPNPSPQELKEAVSKTIGVMKNFLPKVDGAVFSAPFYQDLVCENVTLGKDGVPTIDFLVTTHYWMRNTHNIMHGGCVATMIDDISSISMVADPKLYAGSPQEDEILNGVKAMGVSRHLQLHYIKGTPIDSKVIVRCTLVANTKRNALIDIQVLDQQGVLLVSASHDKSKVVSTL